MNSKIFRITPALLLGLLMIGLKVTSSMKSAELEQDCEDRLNSSIQHVGDFISGEKESVDELSDKLRGILLNFKEKTKFIWKIQVLCRPIY